MGKKQIGLALVMLVFSAVSWSNILVDNLGQNMMVKEYHSEETSTRTKLYNPKRASFPTRVIRIDGKLTNPDVNCEMVQRTLNESFLNRLPSSHYMYHTIVFCRYDQETKSATRLVVNSYFDPLTAADENALEQLEQEYEGYDFFGVPMHIEKASGVAVSLEMIAGREDRRGDPRFVHFRRDHNTLFFQSNYDLNTQFISDIRGRFFTQDKNKVLPFLSSWFHPGIEKAYAALLPRINLVELMPERIFLMPTGKPVFTSHMHMYYTHHCQKYENRKCLIS